MLNIDLKFFICFLLFLSLFPLYSMELSKPRLNYAQKATTEISEHLEAMHGPRRGFYSYF